MDGFAKAGRHVVVGNHRATVAQFESGAFPAQSGKETAANFDSVTAAAERYVDDAHASRIEPGPAVASLRLRSRAVAHWVDLMREPDRSTDSVVKEEPAISGDGL